MIEKKISELPSAASVRSDDVLPIVTGLRDSETPTTQQVSKSRLLMTEGAAAATDYIMSLEPIHYWTMDGNLPLLDEVTGNYAAKTTAEPNSLVASVFLGSQRITELVSNNVRVNTATPIFNLTGSFTFVFAIRNTSQNINLMGNRSSANNSGVAFAIGSNGEMFFNRWSGGSNISLQTPNNNFLANTLSAAAGVFDIEQGMKIYRNGVEIASNSLVTPTTNGEFEPIVFYMAGLSTNIGNHFRGIMQDVAIFDKALTPTEVANISTAILGA
jgi:hypothetical protein